jgi:tetratricopeptide (TPR) repeat protein
MLVHSNPYIAGNPVRGQSHFVGRSGILRDVLRLLSNPHANAIALYGQRRIGKTSILFQLEHQLAESGNYLPVYFDLHDKADLPLSLILYRLAGQIARYVDVPSLEKSRFDVDGTFFHNDFLPNAVKQTQKKLILLFDEFDVLDRPYKGQVGATFLPYLRKWMTRTYQVHFVLAMGRRPEDLSARMLNAFKQVRARHVSLMDLSESLAIVRQSEQNQTLYWSEGGINRVCYWTQGHPYLTQLLCSEVWEAAYDENPADAPTAGPDDVDLAVEATLEQGANAFQWIWNGLPPTEKVMMAAMAGTGRLNVTREQLGETFDNSGVCLIRGELDSVPETLIRLDLLQRVENGYRFTIPLLQRWVAENRPLRRVKVELDSLEPQAENLQAIAQRKYAEGDLTAAEMSLRRALAINPHHVQARLLLGRVHLDKGNYAEAVAILESAYKSDPLAARQGLIAALLALVDTQQSEDEQWQTLSRILRVSPDQSAARQKKEGILRGWAEKAMDEKEFEVALNAYDQLNDGAGTAKARKQLRRQSLSRPWNWLSRLQAAK